MTRLAPHRYIDVALGMNDVKLMVALYDKLRSDGLGCTFNSSGHDLMDSVRWWAGFSENTYKSCGVGVIVYNPDIPLGKKNPAHLAQYDEIAKRLGLEGKLYGGIYAIMRTREYRIGTKYVALVDSAELGEALTNEGLAHAYLANNRTDDLPALIKKLLQP